MKLNDVKLGIEHVYYNADLQVVGHVVAVHADDGATLLFEPYRDGDLSGEYVTTEACYLTPNTVKAVEELTRRNDELQQLINGCPECGSVPEVPLTDQLSELIAKVFDNEEAFLAEFFPEGIAVDEFYMAGERCRVGFQPDHTTTIKTADFLAWAEGLNGE